MGFVYKKRDTKRYIYEQKNIIEQRHAYLYKIREYRHETDQLVIQTRRGLMHIMQNTTFGWIVMEKEAGRYRVGKGRG